MDSGEICIPNINAKERRKRLMGGVVAFVVALLALALLLWLDVGVWWRLLLFPLFFGATSGFFQWRDKT